MAELTARQKTAIKELENILNSKTQERSKLNYDITHLKETIEMVKNRYEEGKERTT